MKAGCALLIGLVLLVGLGGYAYAGPFGTNITISDNMPSGSSGSEDNEVEPGNVAKQRWDLEAFFLQGNLLTVVGGFDFKNGVADPYPGRLSFYRSGDIFIDTNGQLTYGAPLANNQGSAGGGPYTLSNSLFGYEYVIDLNFSTLTYDVYELNTNSSLLSTVYFDQNSDANPWAYHSGGSSVSGFTNVAFDYYTNLADTEVDGLLGLYDDLSYTTHNAFTVSLSFLPVQTTFISHFTVECGNDNLMGSGTTPGIGNPPVPEPGSLLLLSLGLFGAAFLRRMVRA